MRTLKNQSVYFFRDVIFILYIYLTLNIKAMTKALIIDDNLDTCKLLTSFLSRKNFDTDHAINGYDGLKKVVSFRPEIVLCDFRLPDRDGLEMIREIKKIDPSVSIIIITGYADVQLAVKAIKIGAFEYVTKPIFPEEILMNINQALKAKALKQEQLTAPSSGSSEIKKETKTVSPTSNKSIVKGNSQQSKQLFKLIDLVSPTDMTVMVLGESGTGKEVTAQEIHRRSKRKDKPFVAVDCGALPKEIAGSELFGHKKGAFTGALKDKKGYFELANGGTLFLDEIGNLSYENQIKLLRVLQERKVRKLGDEKDIDVNVRIVVATNEALKDNVVQGKFREDLYYRLNEFKIELEPLRNRTKDVADFIDYFIEKANRELEKDIKGVSAEVLKTFQAYHWPGNIRELGNIIKRAVLLCQEDKIKEHHIPQEVLNPKLFLQVDDIQSGNRGTIELTDLKSIVEEAERKAIGEALKRTSFNKTKCAELLGVDRKTLYNKIKAYSLE